MKNASSRLLFLALCAALWPSRATPVAAQTATPMRALIVGGGPDYESNQVAIESNVRYLHSLLGTAPSLTLFADGKTSSETVLYQEDESSPRPGWHAVDLMVNGADALFRGPNEALRAPRLGKKLDGPSTQPAIVRAFDTLAAQQKRAPRSLLLYFTGHGGDNRANLDNNAYSLWGGGNFSVQQMAAQLKKVPDAAPVVLVMVQCYSGSFANILFENGDPKSRVLARDIAGFFAATRERMAAGCTSEVNEAEYHDFTSYFFAALSGRDRVGRRVSTADFDRDGRVGMNEAFCYALANDISIDVPTCTSDAFLRRFVKTPDSEVFATEYSQVLEWASPAQRAALEAISRRLKPSGETRLQQTFEAAREGERAIALDEHNDEMSVALRGALAAFEKARTPARARLMARFPNVNSQDARRREAARKAALSWAESEGKRGAWSALSQAGARVRAVALAEAKRDETRDVTHAYRLRFIRLAKSVVLARNLQSQTDDALKARYVRLLESEARSLPLK